MSEADDSVVEMPGGEGRSGAELVARLEESFPAASFDSFEPAVGPIQHVARVEPPDLVEFVTAAKAEGFDLFVDLCGVDYFRRDPRFEVVITLLSMDPAERLRVAVPVGGAQPEVPSISSVFPGANFYERETFDLFGIEFVGHPDLTRILLPDDWEGHPLRKDYGVGSVPVQFKDSHQAT